MSLSDTLKGADEKGSLPLVVVPHVNKELK